MEDKEILRQYLPEPSIDLVYQWIVENKIQLKINRSRSTKLGDYRPPVRQPNHRITVNHDLNPYSFLITFIHEVAHLKVYEQYKNKVAPHGKEWKSEYRKLINPFMENGSFPDDVSTALSKSLINAKASSTSDIELTRVLQLYDTTNNHVHLETLAPETIFQTQNGRQFKKGNRVRTRYKCLNLRNKRQYLFHPLTPVIPVQD